MAGPNFFVAPDGTVIRNIADFASLAEDGSISASDLSKMRYGRAYMPSVYSAPATPVQAQPLFRGGPGAQAAPVDAMEAPAAQTAPAVEEGPITRTARKAGRATAKTGRAIKNGAGVAARGARAVARGALPVATRLAPPALALGIAHDYAEYMGDKVRDGSLYGNRADGSAYNSEADVETEGVSDFGFLQPYARAIDNPASQGFGYTDRVTLEDEMRRRPDNQVPGGIPSEMPPVTQRTPSSARRTVASPAHSVTNTSSDPLESIIRDYSGPLITPAQLTSKELNAPESVDLAFNRGIHTVAQAPQFSNDDLAVYDWRTGKPKTDIFGFQIRSADPRDHIGDPRWGTITQEMIDNYR